MRPYPCADPVIHVRAEPMPLGFRHDDGHPGRSDQPGCHPPAIASLERHDPVPHAMSARPGLENEQRFFRTKETESVARRQTRGDLSKASWNFTGPN
jgi:hypothetical protein